jgi:hypothetical protein
MLCGIIEEIERLHGDAVARREEPQPADIEEALARCLRELRALAALEARHQNGQRPPLRIV